MTQRTCQHAVSTSKEPFPYGGAATGAEGQAREYRAPSTEHCTASGEVWGRRSSGNGTTLLNNFPCNLREKAPFAFGPCFQKALPSVHLPQVVQALWPGLEQS